MRPHQESLNRYRWAVETLWRGRRFHYAERIDTLAALGEREPDPPTCPIYLYDNEGSPGAEEQSSEYVTHWREKQALRNSNARMAK